MPTQRQYFCQQGHIPLCHNFYQQTFWILLIFKLCSAKIVSLKIPNFWAVWLIAIWWLDIGQTVIAPIFFCLFQYIKFIDWHFANWPSIIMDYVLLCTLLVWNYVFKKLTAIRIVVIWCVAIWQIVTVPIKKNLQWAWIFS